MKRYLRLLLMSLSLSICASTTLACNQKENNITSSTEPTTNDELAVVSTQTSSSSENEHSDEVITPPEKTSIDVKIAGTPFSEYKIICAKEGANGNPQIEAAKYADTVQEFVKLIESVTGNRLEVLNEAKHIPEGTKTIHFGKNSRPDDDFAYATAYESAGEYTVKLLENGNIVLAGDNACAALAAGEALVNAICNAGGELTALDLTGEKKLVTVACIGDSITYGTNSKDSSIHSYPAYLQQMLGYDYYVEKYGAPSHSLIETDTPSFLKHGYFKQSVKTAPDVVIVMLGTNDCRTQKWEDSAYKDWSDSARTQAFLDSGRKLVDAYRGANEDVQIIFSTCPTVPQDAWLGSDWTERIENYGNPLINSLADEYDCPVIDIFSFSEEHPEMFEGGDGLHPQDEQYKILAQGIYDMVKDIIKKPE